MNKISPFLWFNGQAEAATNFYVSVFKNSKINHITPLPGDGSAITSFEIEGQKFMALDGGPMFTITPGISLFVDCADQAEVDDLWAKLSEGGTIQQCGWLQDKFGVSWQIIPTILGQLMGDPDPVKSGRTMQAMLQMTKIEIDKLQAAYDGV